MTAPTPRPGSATELANLLDERFPIAPWCAYAPGHVETWLGGGRPGRLGMRLSVQRADETYIAEVSITGVDGVEVLMVRKHDADPGEAAYQALETLADDLAVYANSMALRELRRPRPVRAAVPVEEPPPSTDKVLLLQRIRRETGCTLLEAVKATDVVGLDFDLACQHVRRHGRVSRTG